MVRHVDDTPERTFNMVPAPPRGERDRGRNETIEEGTVILGKENENGKGVINASIMPRDGEGCSGIRKEETNNQGIRRTGQCVPKSKTVPKLQIEYERVREDIQYMKERALIGKFVGIWPTKKTLVWWINSTWKPHGHFDLQLGAKGFFTIIFFNEEDKTKIFENGPCFYNSVGLFLRPWKETFDPNKENMTIAPVWIRMYSLPTKY